MVVPTTTHSGALHLTRVIGADANGAGGLLLQAHEQLGLVDVSSGSGMLVYEVVSANPFAVESITVPVVVCPGVAGPVPCPALAPDVRLHHMQAGVSFGPVSAVATSDKLAPEPRFVDSATPMGIP